MVNEERMVREMTTQEKDKTTGKKKKKVKTERKTGREKKKIKRKTKRKKKGERGNTEGKQEWRGSVKRGRGWMQRERHGMNVDGMCELEQGSEGRVSRNVNEGHAFEYGEECVDRGGKPGITGHVIP